MTLNLTGLAQELAGSIRAVAVMLLLGVGSAALGNGSVVNMRLVGNQFSEVISGSEQRVDATFSLDPGLYTLVVDLTTVARDQEGAFPEGTEPEDFPQSFGTSAIGVLNLFFDVSDPITPLVMNGSAQSMITKQVFQDGLFDGDAVHTDAPPSTMELVGNSNGFAVLSGRYGGGRVRSGANWTASPSGLRAYLRATVAVMATVVFDPGIRSEVDGRAIASFLFNFRVDVPTTITFRGGHRTSSSTTILQEGDSPSSAVVPAECDDGACVFDSAEAGYFMQPLSAAFRYEAASPSLFASVDDFPAGMGGSFIVRAGGQSPRPPSLERGVPDRERSAACSQW